MSGTVGDARKRLRDQVNAAPGGGEVEAHDLAPFVDALACAQYLDLDSHAATMTWEEYKADDYNGARVLYVEPMLRYVLRALPKLPPRPSAQHDREVAAKALREAADVLPEWRQTVYHWLIARADAIQEGRDA